MSNLLFLLFIIIVNSQSKQKTSSK